MLKQTQKEKHKNPKKKKTRNQASIKYTKTTTIN